MIINLLPLKMKKSSFFFAILLLLLSPAFIFAANINLKDTSKGKNKTISVEVDSKGEKTNSLKVTIFFSKNVTISETKKGDFECGTFSAEQIGSTVEITCTTQEEDAINSSIAEINFTCPTDDYSFTVVVEDSMVGNLAIEEINSIGVITFSEEDDTTPSAQGAKGAGSSTGEKTMKEYSPYILLGIAGVFLLSIIILLVTKAKGTEKSNPQENPPVSQVPTTSETIPTVETKPTLQEMVNATENVVAPMEEAVPSATIEELVDTNTPLTGNHEKDLEAILLMENPGMSTTMTPPEETVLTPEIQEAQVEPEAPQQIEQAYVANTLDGGLPNIGTQSPIHMDAQSIDATSQPVEATEQATYYDPFSAPDTTVSQPITTPIPTQTDEFIAPTETPIGIPQQNTYEQFPAPEVSSFQPEVATVPTQTDEFTAPTQTTTTTPQPTFDNAFSSLNDIPAQPKTENPVIQSEEPQPLIQDSIDMDLQTLVNNEVNSIQTSQAEPTVPSPTGETTQV